MYVYASPWAFLKMMDLILVCCSCWFPFQSSKPAVPVSQTYPKRGAKNLPEAWDPVRAQTMAAYSLPSDKVLPIAAASAVSGSNRRVSACLDVGKPPSSLWFNGKPRRKALSWVPPPPHFRGSHQRKIFSELSFWSGHALLTIFPSIDCRVLDSAFAATLVSIPEVTDHAYAGSCPIPRAFLQDH